LVRDEQDFLQLIEKAIGQTGAPVVDSELQ
jgi:hypothetical protein